MLTALPSSLVWPEPASPYITSGWLPFTWHGHTRFLVTMRSQSGTYGRIHLSSDVSADSAGVEGLPPAS